MKSFIAATMALAASAAATPVARASNSKTPAVSVKGNAFFTADGNRFFIRGVDYQPGGSSKPVDPIADPSTCKRDIQKFSDLGINTVRIYTVDNSANHDECMQALSDAGIYLALDVNSGKYSLNRAQVAESYNPTYLQSVFATIDAFSKYDNTLLFFSGNEVINSPDTTNCAPYIKAVTRDMKGYIKAQGYRQIPVGYSAADVESNRLQTAQYMNCGDDSVRADFFAFNDYSWCDPSSFTTSGWDQKVKQYANYSIPLFLSEFGCNKNPPRDFGEVAALYSAEMTAVYSGGLVYEYSEEADNPHYGLVQINGANSVTPLTDYQNLKKQYAANPAPTGDAGYKPEGAASTCPPKDANWEVDGDMIPTLPTGATKYMKSGAGTAPGLNGPGSQTAGGASTTMTNGGNGGQVSSNTDGSSGTSTGSSSSSKASGTSNAAVGLSVPQMSFLPLACALAVTLSAVLGGASIL